MGLEEYSRETNRPPVDKWRDYLEKVSPRTKELYDYQLNEFCEFFSTDINGLVEYHKKDIENKDGKGVERAFRGWLEYAQKERADKLTQWSAESYLKPVNALFGECELKKIKWKFTQAHPEAKQKITRTQIQDLIRNTRDARMRALFMILKDTGLRVSDTAQLTIDDFNSAITKEDERGNQFKQWQKPIITQKTNLPAYVHLGYESIEAVQEYIDSEGRTSGSIFMTIQKGVEKPLTGKALTIRVLYHLKPLKEEGYSVSAHSFRKLYITNMIDAGVPEIAVKLLCGKAVSQSDKAYYQSDRLLEFYMKAYSEALDTSNRKELENMRDRVQELEKVQTDRVAKQLDQSQTIELLQRKIEQQDRLMEELRNALLQVAKSGSFEPTLSTPEEVADMDKVDKEYKRHTERDPEEK